MLLIFPVETFVRPHIETLVTENVRRHLRELIIYKINYVFAIQ
jgi:hypothetical protein